MVADTPPTHGISTAVLMTNYRGGHATPPKRTWRITNTETPARVVKWSWVTTFTPIPRAPKGCIVRYGQNNAAAKRMGLVSVTWDCP